MDAAEDFVEAILKDAINRETKYVPKYQATTQP